jgi:acyl-coenzyme A thioesterase PaaI-like protein
VPISHHDLCFGCGLANVFGIHLEAEPAPEGGVAGRFFVKQDHQGPCGRAHGGVIGAALDEAMALALHAEGLHAWTRRYEVELHLPAPVGSFVNVRARIERRDSRRVRATASASGEGGTIAQATAVFVVVAEADPGV